MLRSVVQQPHSDYTPATTSENQQSHRQLWELFEECVARVEQAGQRVHFTKQYDLILLKNQSLMHKVSTCAHKYTHSTAADCDDDVSGIVSCMSR